MSNDFFRVAACVPQTMPGDCHANVSSIIDSVKNLSNKGVRLAVFPELSITGYTCGDLFLNRHLLDSSNKEIARLARETESEKLAIVVGAPVLYNNSLYNCAVTICRGRVVMIVPKTYTPTYGEFYERRWWTPAYDAIEGSVTLLPGQIENVTFGRHNLLMVDGVKIGMEICEDLWVPVPPSSFLAMGGAEIILNLSASDDTMGKYAHLRELIEQQSARAVSAYVYASAGFGESSTDAVFDGKALIAECGTMLAHNRRWQEISQSVIADIDLEAINHDRMMKNSFADCARHSNPTAYRIVSVETGASQPREILHPFSDSPCLPSPTDETDQLSEALEIQAAALARRLMATGSKRVVIGISGGLDSTLALLACCKTFDRMGLPREGILGVTMPGFGTTDRTHDNAIALMNLLGISTREISIVPSVELHFKDIGHDISNHDVTYENAQARMRTLLLMDIANQQNALVIGTGDMSELALGWATFNGDHMSMYGVNAGIPKTLVKRLVKFCADTISDDNIKQCLYDVIDTPISPELGPSDPARTTITQKTEDLVGPYELHDFFLYHTLRYGRSPRKIYTKARNTFDTNKYSNKTIVKWLRKFFSRFFSQQFKRSCMPDGPKVLDISLSPRSDWRMPSDASPKSWLREIDDLEAEINKK